MTEALNTILNDSTYEVSEKRRHISKERAHNVFTHLVPLVVGSIALAGAAYDIAGPKKEIGMEIGTITTGHGISDAAEQARIEFQAKTGIELPYSDVFGASQVAQGVADKNHVVHPGNIELHVAESPLLHRDIVTITGASANEK